jgi:predicted NBD/HSP70 family sugar kinase
MSLLVRELIDEGRLLRGHGETVGEFGHTHVIADGPPCKCGGFGCLEAIASAPALAAKARKAVLEGSNSHVTSRFGHPLPTF